MSLASPFLFLLPLLRFSLVFTGSFRIHNLSSLY
uniref:Uncharacterized protein n=1 Tax=Anguilla anguilla TaxID=7936 RepID=A0A0E9TAF9_ANGAN